MISKLECICYAQIALLNILARGKEISPYILYCEMCKILNIE